MAASRRLGPDGDAARNYSFPELHLASAEGSSGAEAQSSLLGARYAVGDEGAEQHQDDLELISRAASGVIDNFTGGIRHLDAMPSEIRLAIFKHLEAADLCRLGCTSRSVESWLRIQSATWAQCLVTTCYDSASPSGSLNLGRPQEAYCFPLGRLGSLGLAAAPYAEAIAAYADVPEYGKEVCACA